MLRWKHCLVGLAILAGFALTTALDRPTVLFLRRTGPLIGWPVWPFVNAWGIAGLWLFVALGYGTFAGVRARCRTAESGVVRVGAILVPVILAGLIGEGLKLVVRRERPPANAEYGFRAWAPPWDNTSGLGMPSTHAAVAFAASAALRRLHPRGRWAWYAMAAGCAVTRLQPNASGENAHFLSDVFVGAVLGTLAERWINRELPARYRVPMPPPRGATAPEVQTMAATTGTFAWMTWPATIALTLGVLVLRIVYLRYGCAYELLGDEAHVWDWTRNLDLCYDIKGPGIAYLIAASTWLLGTSEWTVRLPMAICSVVATLALARLATACSNGDQRVGFLAAAAFLLAPAFQANAQITTPDGPLIACWILACWALHTLVRRLEAGRPTTRAWLVFAATLGAGVLFKQSMLLLLPGLPIYAWLRRKRITWRRTLLRDAALALLVFGAFISPILIWNAQHNWQTLRPALGHFGAPGGDQPHAVIGENAYSPLWTFKLWGAQIGAFGPPLIALMILASVEAVRRRAGQPQRWGPQLLMLCCALPALAVYTLVTFWKKAEGNWPFHTFATLLVLAAQTVLPALAQQRAALRTWRRDPRRPRPWRGLLRRRPESPRPLLWHGVVIYGVCGWLAFSFLNVWAETRTLGKYLDSAGLDVQRQHAAAVAACVAQLKAQSGREPVLMSGHYMVAALHAFYMPGRPAVYCVQQRFGGRPSAYDFWKRTAPNAPTLRGRDAILLGKNAELWWGVVRAERIELLDAERGVYLAHDYMGLR